MPTFEDICKRYELIIHDTNGNLMPFQDVIKQIYYDWDIQKLQDFMTAIMEVETHIGEVVFDHD